MINTQMVETIPNIIAAHFPSDEMEVMVEEIASQVVELVQENTKITPVQANVIKTNDKEGFAVTMVPLLIVLASYIGAMLISQHLQLSEAKLKSEYNRSALFIGRQ